MSVEIHGKVYITVAERLTKAHEENEKISITTEVLFTNPQVVVKATVVTPKGTFTGISAANAAKQIEKESPYEVAETSAVGRALAFAGYETTNGIASAEEIYKAGVALQNAPERTFELKPEPSTNLGICPKCSAPMKLSKLGKKYCSALCWQDKLPVKTAE